MLINQTAIILAGGKNSRMNYKDKSFLKYNGKTFIEKILESVSNYSEIIIVSNNPSEYSDYDVKVIEDIIQGFGPLGGMHVGLQEATFDNSLFLPCDMPFIEKSFVEYLGSISEGYDIVVPKFDGFYQPLCAVYSKACLPYIQKCMDNNIRKVIDFYDEVNLKVVGEDIIKTFGDADKMFKNINTPEEYKNIKEKQKGG